MGTISQPVCSSGWVKKQGPGWPAEGPDLGLPPSRGSGLSAGNTNKSVVLLVAGHVLEAEGGLADNVVVAVPQKLDEVLQPSQVPHNHLGRGQGLWFVVGAKPNN